MERQEKIIITAILSAIAITVIIWGVYQNSISVPLNTVTKFFFIKIVHIDRKDIFDTMADVENYPNILTGNVLSVDIKNKTSNTIFAEEQVSEAGVQTKLLAKHTIIPYEKHTMEIISGDANGTVIIITFDDVNSSSTKISAYTELHLRGILAPFGMLGKENLEHAMNTVITKFVEHTQNQIRQ